jgi:dTDP-glucose 4,6-dehydratase
MDECILVTGGCGFIGSNFIRGWRARERAAVVNLDKLTYAGNAANLAELAGRPGYAFAQIDICEFDAVLGALRAHRPRAVIHFAAESHVDRSIVGPAEFVRTNVNGTFCLLEAARAYVADLPLTERAQFRFLHVSTDEVYGSLAPHEAPFHEDSPHRPNSPYAASKSAADGLVRAYFHTYGLPTVTVNCSNNYGPYQFPEKLIPLMILNAIEGKPLPVYGDGLNVRDWLYVEDHCAAIGCVLAAGTPGQTYNVGGSVERTNLQVVHGICDLLDELLPASRPRRELIVHVADRPGHDRRYAVDTGKVVSTLGWRPAEAFESGLRKTVQWYLANRPWANAIRSGEYRSWMRANYETRGTA